MILKWIEGGFNKMIMINEEGSKMQVIFGTGDIGMNPGVMVDGSDISGVMVMYNQKPRPIGSTADIKAGQTVSLDDHPISFIFNNVSSLEVFIRALNEVKDSMNFELMRRNER